MKHQPQPKLPQSWRYLLAFCIQKQRYEAELNRRRALPLFQRIKETFKGGFLKDPCKGIPAEGLAHRYVQAFNEQDAVKLTRLDNGETGRTVSSRVLFHTADLLPFLRFIYYDGNTYFESAMLFKPDGSAKEMGIQYPESECGVTGFPDPVPDDIKAALKKFQKNIELIKEVIESANHLCLG